MAPQQPSRKTPEQIAAEARAIADENSEASIGTEEDGARSTRTAKANQNQNDDAGLTRREPIPRPPTGDDIRSQIAARFRRTTPENERPFNGDMTDSENTIGELGQNLEGARNPEDDDELEQEAIRRASLVNAGLDPDIIGDEGDPSDTPRGQEEPEPRRHKLKVRGKEIEMTDEEVLEAARKTLAGDSYLEESRAILEEAKRIRAGTAPNRSPTGDETSTDDLDPPTLDDGSPSQEPSVKSVVEKIQFGDPDEAAAELERLIDSRAGKKANEGQLQRAFDQDLSRSQKALKAFQDANPDLANDEIAAMAIEATMYQLYREDMKALGLDDDQIPKDRSAAANWHRFYRINGYEVRPTSALLEAAKDKFVKWRGKGQPGQSSQPQPRKAPPSVQVSVNRDARRAAIPVQPSRSTVVRRDPAGPASAVDARQAAVMAMRRARGQIIAS